MIREVEENSIAQELGLEPGDVLVSINGMPIRDVFDYRYLVKDEYLEVLIRKANGEEWELEIEKDEDEELGLVFDTGLMDKASTCKNKCIFCFIDQLPPGLRETLYFKDDDARLGFLQGNYVTLTNISDGELDRIIYYHLSPINISVHTTDDGLRRYMLKNPNSSRLPGQIRKLYDAGIEMNYQVVLCKGINDGKQLDRTISDLSRYIPKARSLSVVPVGLSKYRKGLAELEAFTPEDALAVINQVEAWQRRFKSEKSTAFVFAADEFYLLGGREIPGVTEYEGFPQIENGVGMLALFKDEFESAMKNPPLNPEAQRVTIVTGAAAHRFISCICDTISAEYPLINLNAVAVENKFLGESITVSGLLTGRDILNKLKGQNLGRVLIPRNALRSGDSVFLDDMNLRDLAKELGVPVQAVETTGHEFLRNVMRRI